MKEQYERQIEEFKHKFITPRCPEQNGLIERVIRTLKGSNARTGIASGSQPTTTSIAPDEDHREGISCAIMAVVAG